MSLAFSMAVDAAGVTLTPEAPKRGLLGRLVGGSAPLDLERLPAQEREIADALADLRALADETGAPLEIDHDRVRLSHDLLSRIDGRTAEALGLPGLPVHLVFATEANGTLGAPTFRLAYEWRRSGRRVAVNREGAILKTDRGPRRIPNAILQAIEIAEAFDAGAPLADHWAALARFRQSLDPDEGPAPERPDFAAKVQMTGFLNALRIALADAVSISPREAPDGLDFEAVPFSRAKLAKEAIPANDVGEEDAVLEGADLQAFQRGIRQKGALPAYRLGEGGFLVVDRAAAPVLDVIAEKQQAPAAERAAFVRNPRPAVEERVTEALRSSGALEGLGDKEVQEAVEAVAEPALIETRQYAERVIGVGVWKPPELPVEPAFRTTWLPEIFTEALKQKLDAARPHELRGLAEEAAEAYRVGKSEVAWKDERVPVDEERVRALEGIASAAEEAQREAARVEKERQAERAAARIVVETTDNFLELQWRPDLTPRTPAIAPDVPESVTTALLPHQEEAFRWAASAWETGLPGILNADEQGLGKTLQTIAFLAWLVRHMEAAGPAARRPILVVAPTSLLENWEAEVERHMAPGGLGNLIPLYGSALSSRKRKGLAGRDTDDGVERLAFDVLLEAIADGRGHRQWLITTYTTLRNYHHSLARIPFAAAVFDEIQALKNPATLGAGAARAINADFRIGLTGTPVENRAVDLWAIMDQLAPGALGSLEEFSRAFGTVSVETMRSLHGHVFRPADGRPPLGLRRMKSQVAKGLPPKQRLLHPRPMPPEQASAYAEAREELARGDKGAMLRMLHHIRSVSVHPGGDTGADSDEAFIAASARLSATIEILRSIEARGERALVFVEHRQMQYRFAELVRRIFGLENVPIINGDTPIKQRLAIVNRFQRHVENDGGFDLLVLGPRAAGTGLTLTAASHVIHLSRWWNPAVEEQCNDRAHRIGQDRPVTIHIPLAVHPEYLTGSFDCLLQSLMRRKRSLATSVLWPSGDTDEDVSSLEKALTEEAPSDARRVRLDPAFIEAAIEELGGYRSVEPLGPETFRIVPNDPDERPILLVVGEDAAHARATLGGMTASAEAFASAIVLSGESTDHRPEATGSGCGIPTSALSGRMITLWPDYALETSIEPSSQS